MSHIMLVPSSHEAIKRHSGRVDPALPGHQLHGAAAHKHSSAVAGGSLDALGTKVGAARTMTTVTGGGGTRETSDEQLAVKLLYMHMCTYIHTYGIMS